MCSVVDPRGDQAHFGPNFISFHRADVLLLEQALRSVDPTIAAIPYWNMALDSDPAKCLAGDTCGIYHPSCVDYTHLQRCDPSQYIFTDRYFGSYQGDVAANFAVINGLFHHWKMPVWNETLYGVNGTMAQPGLLNRVTTCLKRGLFSPALPGTRGASANPHSLQARDLVAAGEVAHHPGSVEGQSALSIPDYCPADCRADSTKCPLYGRLDRYSCIEYVQRNPLDMSYSSVGGWGTNDITYSEQDFEACTEPENVKSWMGWQNCIEKGIDGLCELASPLLMNTFEHDAFLPAGEQALLAKEGRWENDAVWKQTRTKLYAALFEISNRTLEHTPVNYGVKQSAGGGIGRGYDVDVTQTMTSMPLQFWCIHLRGFYDTERGRRYVQNLHAQAHIRVGLDLFDTGTSAADLSTFHGHHANADRSMMSFQVKQAQDHSREAQELRDAFYLFPHNTHDLDPRVTGKVPYGTSGPWSSYSITYNFNRGTLYRYGLGLTLNPEDKTNAPHVSEHVRAFCEDADFGCYDFDEPWLKGTTLDDVVSRTYPFFNLFAGNDGGAEGYTHREIIANTKPDVVDYTYDSLAHFYEHPLCDGMNAGNCKSIDSMFIMSCPPPIFAPDGCVLLFYSLSLWLCDTYYVLCGGCSFTGPFSPQHQDSAGTAPTATASHRRAGRHSRPITTGTGKIRAESGFASRI